MTARSRASARAAGTRTWILELPYPRPPLTLNQRLHWAAKARLTKRIGTDVQILARSVRLPKGIERVEITLRWQASIERKRDHDNLAPTLKACIDGLVRYGLVVDDDADHVLSGCRVEPGRHIDRVWLEITDLSEETA